MTRTLRRQAPAIPFAVVLVVLGFGLFFIAVGIVAILAACGVIR